MLVYSEDQQAKKMLQDMRWDKKLLWYWNNSQNRILGTETPAGPEEIGPQLPPREGTADPWAGSDDGPDSYSFTEVFEHSTLLTDKWEVQAQINYFGTIIIQTNPVHVFNFDY